MSSRSSQYCFIFFSIAFGCFLIYLPFRLPTVLYYNKPKGGIRRRKSKDRQHNAQKGNKRTKNDLQTSAQKNNDRATQTPLKSGGELSALEG